MAWSRKAVLSDKKHGTTPNQESPGPAVDSLALVQGLRKSTLQTPKRQAGAPVVASIFDPVRVQWILNKDLHMNSVEFAHICSEKLTRFRQMITNC